MENDQKKELLAQSKKEDSNWAVGSLFFFALLAFLIGGWKGVGEWGGKVLLSAGIFGMIFWGIPFLKKYVFENDVSPKTTLSRGAHLFILKPIAFIVLAFLIIFAGFFFISWIGLRTDGLIGY